MKKGFIGYSLLIGLVIFISVRFNTEPMEIHGNNRYELVDGIINLSYIEHQDTEEGLSGYEYYMTVDDFGKTFLEKVSYIPGENTITKKERVNSQILNGILRVVNEQKMESRNNFNDKRAFLSGGQYWSVSVDYANQKTIRAQGYKSIPEGYESGSIALVDTLESYFK